MYPMKKYELFCQVNESSRHSKGSSNHTGAGNGRERVFVQEQAGKKGRSEMLLLAVGIWFVWPASVSSLVVDNKETTKWEQLDPILPSQKKGRGKKKEKKETSGDIICFLHKKVEKIIRVKA